MSLAEMLRCGFIHKTHQNAQNCILNFNIFPGMITPGPRLLEICPRPSGKGGENEGKWDNKEIGEGEG